MKGIHPNHSNTDGLCDDGTVIVYQQYIWNCPACNEDKVLEQNPRKLKSVKCPDCDEEFTIRGVVTL